MVDGVKSDAAASFITAKFPWFVTIKDPAIASTTITRSPRRTEYALDEPELFL